MLLAASTDAGGRVELAACPAVVPPRPSRFEIHRFTAASDLLKIAGNGRRLLTSAASDEEIEMFRQDERTGRVLGDEDFQRRLEKRLGRVLRRQKPGAKRAPSR